MKTLKIIFLSALVFFILTPLTGTAKTYQIGGQYTLTYSNGQYADWGDYARISALLAIEDINSSGILGEDKLEMKTENINDCHCAAQGAKQLGEAMFSNPEIDVVVGVDCTDPAVIMSPIAEQYKIPIVSYGSRSDSLSDMEKFPYFVHVVTPSSYFERIFYHVVELYQFDNIGNIHTSDAWGVSSGKVINEELQKRGITVAGEFSYPKNSSFSIVYTELAKAKAKGIKTFFISMSTPDTTILFQAVKALGMDAEGYAYFPSEILSPNNSQMGILGSIGNFAPKTSFPDSPEFKNYIQRLSEKLGKEVDPNSSAVLWGTLGYDNIWLIAHAIALGKKDGLQEVTHENLMKYIRKASFIGLTGKVNIKEGTNDREAISVDLLNAQGYEEEMSYIERWWYTVKNHSGPQLKYVKVGRLDEEGNFEFAPENALWPGKIKRMPPKICK